MTRRAGSVLATLLLLGATALGGCGEAAPEAPAPEASGSMAMKSEIKTGKGTGTVTAVDAAAGTVTIDHAPMADIGWPAMTMAFKADSTLLAGVAEGDKVAFDLTVEDNAGTITALTTR